MVFNSQKHSYFLQEIWNQCNVRKCQEVINVKFLLTWVTLMSQESAYLGIDFGEICSLKHFGAFIGHFYCKDTGNFPLEDIRSFHFEHCTTYFTELHQGDPGTAWSKGDCKLTAWSQTYTRCYKFRLKISTDCLYRLFWQTVLCDTSSLCRWSGT